MLDNSIFYDSFNEKPSGIEAKKHFHKKSFLKFFYSHGSLSIPELSKLSAISTPTATTLVNELIQEGLVQESGIGTSSGGRKPSLYNIVPNSRYILGIIMGRYSTRITIFNLANERVCDVREVPLTLSNDLGLIDIVYRNACEIIESSGIDTGRLLAVGVGFPGLVSAKEGVNYTFLNFGKIKVRDLLEEKFKIPVFIENDATVMALGEYRNGLAKGRKNVLCIYMGWSLSMGMILDGKIYQGKSGFSGEFGHNQAVDNGELCHCGKNGCLTTIASGRALAKLAKRGIVEGKISHLRYMINEDIDKIEAGLVVKAAQAGDQYAIDIISEVGYELGKGLAQLIHIFNPELIIIGGRLAKAGQYLTFPVQQALNKYCLSRLRDDSDVVVSNLAEKAGLVGTVALVMNNIFTSNNDSNN